MELVYGQRNLKIRGLNKQFSHSVNKQVTTWICLIAMKLSYIAYSNKVKMCAQFYKNWQNGMGATPNLTPRNEKPEHGVTSRRQGIRTTIKHNDFVWSLYRSSSADNSESFKQVSIERQQKFSKKSAYRYGYSKHIAYPQVSTTRSMSPTSTSFVSCTHNRLEHFPHGSYNRSWHLDTRFAYSFQMYVFSAIFI